MSYLVVFVGAGLGGALRHGVNLAAARWLGILPLGTLFVNVLGSFLVGLLAGYFALRGGVSENLRLFLATGVLGGFTTFSAFSLDVALLIERNSFIAAAGYVFASIGFALAGLFLGLAVGRHFGAVL